MNKFRISAVIPAYQSEDTIASCLESLLAQSLPSDEIIVVNDGSTDGTRAILKKYESEGRIRVIDQENRGANPARNRGWREIRGEYVIFLDSDVVMRPDMLEKMFDAFQKNPGVSYAYSSFKYGFKKFKLWPFDAARLRRMPYITTSSLIRSDTFPGFDENIRRLQDWDLWLTLLQQGKIGVWIPEVLFTITPRQNGISRWVPRWLFWIPWRIIGWQPPSIKSYKEAVKKIKEKHHLQ